MKKNKFLLGFALLLSLASFLGACEQNTGGGTDGTTSPAPGTSPAESPSPTTSP